MSDLMQTLSDLQDHARKMHGSDIRLTLARAVAWGHTDNCVLVYGKNHVECAALLVRGLMVTKLRPVVSQQHSPQWECDGEVVPAYTYSVVEF